MIQPPSVRVYLRVPQALLDRVNRVRRKTPLNRFVVKALAAAVGNPKLAEKARRPGRPPIDKRPTATQ